MAFRLAPLSGFERDLHELLDEFVHSVSLGANQRVFEPCGTGAPL
jgi:hypothetical protein